jgi:hypothetical protein
MSDWSLSYNVGGVMETADVSFRNAKGPLISSVALIEPYAAGYQPPPAGIFVIEAVSPISVLVYHKSIVDLKSPVLSAVPKEIIPGVINPNRELISGLDIRFGNGVFEGWKAEIGVGCFWVRGAGIWQRLTSFGIGAQGVTGSSQMIYIKNNTGTDQSNCKILAENSVRVVNGTSFSCPFYSFRQTGLLNPDPDYDLLGSAVTFANLVEGTPNTIDILVRGLSLDVYDVTHETLIVDGLQLLCDGETVYRFDDGTIYRSCEFVLSTLTSESDTATIYVSDGGDFIELYNPATGAFVAGSSGVYMTSDNCGLGVVLADDSVMIEARINPPSGKDITLNQRQISFRIASAGV